jgi:hypothetical protein
MIPSRPSVAFGKVKVGMQDIWLVDLRGPLRTVQCEFWVQRQEPVYLCQEMWRDVAILKILPKSRVKIVGEAAEISVLSTKARGQLQSK